MGIDRSTITTPEGAREAPPDTGRESTLRLGQRLRRARLNRNLTQGEVAKNQFSVSYVSAVERGQIRPSLGALEKLAERLEVPITDLLAEGQFNLPNYPSSPYASAGYGAEHRESRESAADRHREELDTTLRDARLLLAQHRSAEAVELLLRLNSHQLSPRETAQVQRQLAVCYLEQGRVEEARRVAQEAIPLAERAGEPELAERLRLELGTAYAAMHQPTLALEHYQAGLRAIEEQVVPDPVFTVRVLLGIGQQYAAQNETDAAVAVLQQAQEVAQQVVNLTALGAHYAQVSQALATKGEQAGAKSYALRSLAAYEEAEQHQLVAAVSTRLGTVLAQAGRREAAVAQLQTAATLATGQQDARNLAEVQRRLATLYLEEQRLEEANRAAEEAMAQTAQLGDPVQHALSTLLLAKVQEAHKQPREAERNFENAIALLQEAEARSAATDYLRDAYAQYAEFLEHRGDSKRALDILKQAVKSTSRG